MRTLRGAFLETLRLHPVAPGVIRHAAEPFEFGGYRVEAGQEVLVAISILAVVLAAIGALVGSTVRAIRAIDRRVPLLETAQNLLAALPDRNALQVGSQSGGSGDFRWRIDVLPLVVPAPKSLNWIPVAITVQVQTTEGPPLRLDTVRLVPRTAG